MGLRDPEMPTKRSDVDNDMLYNFDSWLARFCRIFVQPYIVLLASRASPSQTVPPYVSAELTSFQARFSEMRLVDGIGYWVGLLFCF